MAQQAKDRTRPLGFGEPVPFIAAEMDGIARYALDVAAGRWMLLMAFGTLGHPASAVAFAAVQTEAALFNDADAAFYGISVDPADRDLRGLRNAAVGLRYFWDFDQRVSRALGVARGDLLEPMVFLIDRSFRVVAAEPVEETPRLLADLRAALIAESAPAPTAFPAPVLTLPRIFEPAFCDALIDHFDAVGGSPSGFASDVDGRTVDRLDPRLKRRTDVVIEDPVLLVGVKERLTERLLPMVKRALGFEATEIERYMIARYAADDAGFFSAHRDDATVGTAHRKFAATLNLNEDYDGGALRFREFGGGLHKPPRGGATVFCCSLLHEVTPVTRGVRYAVVPFLYDEAGLRLRRANMARVAGAEGLNRKARRSGRG